MAQICVAISIVAVKHLIDTIPALILLTIRFSLATLILLPLHYLIPAKNNSIIASIARMNGKDWFYLIAQALSAGIFFNALMISGLQFTDANIAGIITSALPAIIAIMAWLMLKERLYAKTIICILFATIGLIIIAFDKVQGVSLDNSVLGNLLVFGSLFPEAAYYIFTKLHPNRLPIVLASIMINAINALILLIIFAIVHPNMQHISLENWFILIFLGLTAGLFYVFWFLGCRHVEGVKASLATAVMPVATVIFSWGLLGEELSLIQLIGMGLVVFSIIINGY